MPHRNPPADHRLRDFTLYLLLGTLLAVLLGGGALLFQKFNQAAIQEQWVRHTGDVLSEIDLVLSSVKDVETGARGFILTQNRDHLAPFRDGTDAVYKHLGQLRQLTADNPHQAPRIQVMQELAERRLAQLQSLVAEEGRGATAASRRIQIMAEGLTTMNLLRGRADELQSEERRLLSERAQASEDARQVFRLSLLVVTLLSLVSVLVAFRLFVRQQRMAEQDAREQAESVWVQDQLTELARRVSGDVTLETAAKAVLELLARELKILGAKLLVRESGKVRVAATYGAEASDDDVRDSLAQEAMKRKDVWVIDQIPDTFWKIRSSLGSEKPTSLVLFPFVFQGQTIGVIEMAAFTTPTPLQLRLLQEASDLVGVGLHAVLSRVELQKLLEHTQTQSEELQTQHEELQTQQEELRSNNEELEQQARAMEAQQQALAIKNDELVMAKHDLEVKASDLMRSSQYKSEFLAKMSHELRTPLNGLLILSTLLMENKEKNLTDQQKQFAKSIHNAGNDLLVLINDILDLSKIEARKLAVRPESFTVGELFSQLRQNFEVQATTKGIRFETAADGPTLDTRFNTDRIRVEQILRNFLSNAIKFTEKGTVVLGASISPGGERVRISVDDTGIGIPSNKLGLVFEAFEQADSSVSRKYGGTGLGLTIARELAQLLHGEVSVQSREGEGSTFTLEIPIHINAEPAAPAVVDSAATPTLTPFNRPAGASASDLEVRTSASDEAQADAALKKLTPGRKTILIIEDDARFAQSVSEVSDSYKFEPIHAGTAEIALAILQRHTPDAILLDIKLPGVSGLGLLEMIKRMSHLRHVPVHMISGMDYQHNALRMGALGYLTKPVTMEKIRSAMSRIENVIQDHVRKVLVVEDDEKQSFAISQLIAGEDVEVRIARTGKEAMELIAVDHPDCVILDLTLPDITGFDFLEQLNSLNASLPPVVIYTGKDLTSEEEQYLRRYSESIIIKGVRSPERLLDEVNLFLHRVESLLPQDKKNMLSQLRSQEQTFAGKTVLLVDDDYRNLFALTSALEARNLNVRVAKDGVEALESLALHEDIDVVLMDIMMPRMDGFECMKRIRSSGESRLRAMPIIALTAKAMREDHEKCIAAGASDYLPKPVNLEHLVTALKVWLSPKELFA